MWYKDGCQLDAQMNAKIEQSKRHRYINIHPVQSQINIPNNDYSNILKRTKA
jgi:hypothetical protein